jgi:tetratricopeptide (TPR) repeat protein
MMHALILTGLILSADLYQDTLVDANQAYQEGRFEDALVSYRQLASADAPSAAIFYNLGNTHFRLGNVGHAIANYERALQLDPTLEEAHDNLQVALAGTRRSLARPLPPAWQQSLLFWDGGLTGRQVRWAGLAAWVTAWVLLLVRLFRPLPYGRALIAVLMVVSLLAGLSAWSKANPIPLAVAAEEEIPVRVGIGADETSRQNLYAGDRVRVDRAQDGWVQVTTIDGERGWAPAKAFAFVGRAPEGARGQEPA